MTERIDGAATYAAALDAFLRDDAGGWGRLPFFVSGEAGRLCGALDARAAGGAHVLPPAPNLFRAFAHFRTYAEACS